MASVYTCGPLVFIVFEARETVQIPDSHKTRAAQFETSASGCLTLTPTACVRHLGRLLLHGATEDPASNKSRRLACMQCTTANPIRASPRATAALTNATASWYATMYLQRSSSCCFGLAILEVLPGGMASGHRADRRASRDGGSISPLQR